MLNHPVSGGFTLHIGDCQIVSVNQLRWLMVVLYFLLMRFLTFLDIAPAVVPLYDSSKGFGGLGPDASSSTSLTCTRGGPGSHRIEGYIV